MVAAMRRATFPGRDAIERGSHAWLGSSRFALGSVPVLKKREKARTELRLARPVAPELLSSSPELLSSFSKRVSSLRALARASASIFLALIGTSNSMYRKRRGMPERLCISEKVSRSAKRMSRIISPPWLTASNSTSSSDRTEA